MVTRALAPGRRVAALACACTLALAGCGGGDEAVRGLAGGTNSKDKEPIPPTVHSGMAPAAPATGADPAAEAGKVPPEGMSGLAGPAVATKTDEADREKPIRSASNQYRAGRVRDPFASLIGTDERSDLVDLSVVRLVGVVTSGDRPFAIVEDGDGVSYVLRKGDRVKNGRVVRVSADALVCSQTMLGYTTTVELKLERGKDVKNVG